MNSFAAVVVSSAVTSGVMSWFTSVYTANAAVEGACLNRLFREAMNSGNVNSMFVNQTSNLDALNVCERKLFKQISLSTSVSNFLVGMIVVTNQAVLTALLAESLVS